MEEFDSYQETQILILWLVKKNWVLVSFVLSIPFLFYPFFYLFFPFPLISFHFHFSILKTVLNLRFTGSLGEKKSENNSHLIVINFLYTYFWFYKLFGNGIFNLNSFDKYLE